MKKYTAKISKKGQIAIPKKIRDQLSTDFVEIELKKDKIILSPVKSVLELGGSLKSYAKKRDREKEKNAWEKHVKEKFSGS